MPVLFASYNCTMCKHESDFQVLIATNKSDSSTSDEDIMNQISRLFVLVPKTDDESKLHTVFEVWIDYLSIAIL